MSKRTVMDFFFEISQIPRVSHHEEKIADYLVSFAKDHGLRYVRDELHNVVIYKPGSNGRTGEAPLVLQAHSDMVGAKIPGSNHNFLEDPIRIIEKDGWLYADGTTLGADDGDGMSYILAVLEDDDLSHPPLECIFTTQEEDGFGGAKALADDLIQSRRMISLDGMPEGYSIYSTSAVRACRMGANYPEADIPEGHGYSIKIYGLSGGHSGVLIGAQHANAIKVCFKYLHKISELGDLNLISAEGGDQLYGIPTACTVSFKSNAEKEKLEKLIQDLSHQYKTEYENTDPDMQIVLETFESSSHAISTGDSLKMIRLLYLLPTGAVRRDSQEIKNVIGSYSISFIGLESGKFHIDYVCRTNHPLDPDDHADKARCWAELFGLSCEIIQFYDGYYVDKDLPLTKVWTDLYKEKTGNDTEFIFLHGGCDAATIYNKYHMNDFAVMCPIKELYHTPRERMNIESFERVYGYLTEVLARA